jgi:2-polyprenyl-6-methoxyphenol hydroxylase-like FAD-dependent oxidoreductase
MSDRNGVGWSCRWLPAFLWGTRPAGGFGGAGEAEASATARTQGGQLDIHEHNGQRALEDAGLLDQFRAIIHRGGAASRLLDKNAEVLLDEPDDGTDRRPEVLRGDLRRILLESLPPDTVRWSKKLVRVDSVEDGQHTLIFEDGSAVTTAMVVGADGAWSKVRPVLSAAKPDYTGVVFIETYLQDVDARHPDVARLVGSGSMFALAPGAGITAHREAGGTIHTYVQLKRPLEWLEALDFSVGGDAIARVISEFDGWTPTLAALIAGDVPAVARPIFALPDDHRWRRTPGVTLIGDAAHLTLPSGEGANLAMLDGAELANAIAAHPDDWVAALAAYEEPMFARSKAEAVKAHRLTDLILGERAPYGMLEFSRDAT